VLYAGRLAQEKNLELLITITEHLLELRPQAKLVLVGDFDYRATLEQLAGRSSAAAAISFAGRLPRSELSQAYQAGDVFVFPSLTDTQGLVINEAAHAGLPLVLIDTDLTDCFVPGVNGFSAQDDPVDFAHQVARILADPSVKADFGCHSRRLAAQRGELAQTQVLADLYLEVVAGHRSTAPPTAAGVS
jgi:glycosyltransferase involved in cell wall biosynthesis